MNESNTLDRKKVRERAAAGMAGHVELHDGAMRAPLEPVDMNERQQRIAQAAYFRAASRGFAPGEELRDWLEAERELDPKASQ